MTEIQLVSSDLNGTLVHQHTMSEMIRLGFPHEPERFEKAKSAFTRQTAGLLSMEETFAAAGPLTKGLRLRTAIEYTLSEMRFVDGFGEFVRTLREKKILFVINSTGYTVTTEVIKAVYGAEHIHDVICNRLLFAKDGRIIEEKELAQLVMNYVHGDRDNRLYDEISASGTVELGIKDESEKARLLFEISDRLRIPRTGLVHIGDTMGDSRGICEVAAHGGIGIAFNYNEALKTYLEDLLKSKTLSGKILLVSPKSETSDVRNLLPFLCP